MTVDAGNPSASAGVGTGMDVVRRRGGRARRTPAAGAVVLLAACALLALTAAPALACSCVGFTEEEAFARAEAVFTGTVVGYEPPPTGPFSSSADPATWVFHVHEVHKGAVAEPRQAVTSAVSGASCGLEISEEQGTYKVFADGGGAAPGTLGATLCGGTYEVAAQEVPGEQAADERQPADEQSGGAAAAGGVGPVAVAAGGSLLAGLAGFAGFLVWRGRRTG